MRSSAVQWLTRRTAPEYRPELKRQLLTRAQSALPVITLTRLHAITQIPLRTLQRACAEGRLPAVRAGKSYVLAVRTNAKLPDPLDPEDLT